jgi:hypothetical protein
MRASVLRYTLLALGLLCGALPARAQVGSTTDIIMGKVTAPDGSPVNGVRVEVTSAETGITRRKTTNDKGEYSIIFPDGGGSYRVRATFLGFAPYSGSIARQSDEDRLVLNIALSRNAQVLSAVQVRAAPRTDNQQDRPTAGSTERNLSAAQLDRLPVEKGDLNSVATLAPGVTGTAATDSTPATFSVAGQPTNQNQITLDGLSFGSGSVPSEAVRSTRVITNTYDVSRGQFTGGQVASTTRGGTNNLQGVVSYALRDPSLEFVDESSASFGQKYMQNSLNLGVGGPIQEDEMFIFGAASVSRRTNPLSSLMAADAPTLSRLGASPDSVSRFLNRLNTIGLPPTLPGIPTDRLADQASAIVRFDWSLGEMHTLTLRGDWRGSLQDGTRISPFSVPTTGGNLRTMGGGAMATLTSHLGGFINEARIYQSSDRQNTEPYLTVPDGRVTVSSVLADGTRSVTNLQFGGNPSLPQEQHSRLLEATDELSWVSSGGAHRFKLGGLVNDDRATIGTIPNRYGTFSYNSLSDFEANRPAQYTRTISGRDRLAGSNNVALYLGDAWRQSPALQLVYGLRLEGSRFPNTPDYNPDIETMFGRRTDRTPSEVHASPRVGFTLFTGVPFRTPAPDTARQRDSTRQGGQGGRGGQGGGGGPGGQGGAGGPNATNWVVRGGIGEFRGRVSSNLVASAVDATGLPGGSSQLTCIGAAVPVPDWTSYLADPGTIPTQCAGGIPSVTLGQRRNVTLFEEGFGAPKVWRGSLGASRRFFERYSFNVDASFAYGIDQTGSRDLNLDTNPKFTLADERGRPVYAPSTSIFPATGATSINASRLHPEYGAVSEIMSQLHSQSAAVTATLGGLTLQGITFSASYTYLRARDEQNGFSTGGGFGGGGSSTAGNPNVVNWGTSDLERRHSILGTVTYPAANWLDVTAIGRFTAGQRYTPTVSGDVNADGSRNDRAFIFDPANPTTAAVAADTALLNGMSRVLANTTGRARDCLMSQIGDVADRNSCTTPWTPSLDMQLNFKPAAWGLDRRLTLSLQFQNTLVGLDQLLHGSNDLHGWGQPVIPDRTLLFVRGFDAATQRYIYQVNEHFGVAGGQNSAFRVPFQIGLQGRLSVGTDPARQQVRQLFAGPDGKQPTREEYIARMSRLVPDPFKETIALDDSLKLALTAQQKAKLASFSDSLAPKTSRITGDIADILLGAGKNPEPMVVFAKLAGKTNDARRIIEQAIADLKSTLTAEQWAKLPEPVKTVPAGRGMGAIMGGGGRGDGERRGP